jgi:hypothetical protein
MQCLVYLSVLNLDYYIATDEQWLAGLSKRQTAGGLYVDHKPVSVRDQNVNALFTGKLTAGF